MTLSVLDFFSWNTTFKKQGSVSLSEPMDANFTYSSKPCYSSSQNRKGQIFLEDDVKSGKYEVVRVRLNDDIRYCTLKEDDWKLFSQVKTIQN